MNTKQLNLMALGTAALALSGCDAVKDSVDAALDAAGVTVNVVYLAKSRILKRLREYFEGLID